MTVLTRSQARMQSVEIASSRRSLEFKRPKDTQGRPLKVSEYFGCSTFSFELMAQKLPKNDVAVLRQYAQDRQHKISVELADKVALAVKEWAISKGATHYCHWFQPHTGSTAEKHDSFFSYSPDGSGIELFSGKQLIQSEPDASSFPSGGARTTFEARGYTAWDASSPMFLMETESGLTLCIPSVFVSYSGVALDKKTPLLRSIAVLNEAAVESLKLLGHENVKHVVVTCGPEQEYFVIDRAFHQLRPDLMLAKRTLIGRPPPKGQQLEDHYFGSINPRILSFMMEVEHEMFKLGIPVKTRHNEVAPAQYECAPTFEYANVAADHNQLTMELLRSIARKHDLTVLFHEKPFAGINGSGKHVNWSMADNNGHNLLEPGEDPASNMRFLFFLTASIKAVHDHAAMIRVATAGAGNDFRLGANEAPPAIMSVFLGETLAAVLDRLEGKTTGDLNSLKRFIDLELSHTPPIARDNTDRNRTSPFAFTGNKFEFRAVGASASISPALTFLNAAAAASLKEMNQRLRAMAGQGMPTDEQRLQVMREVLKETRKVCFEGNNYSEEWHREAEKRGLPNSPNTPEAIKALRSEKVKKTLIDLQIMSNEELDIRYNVLVERYIKLRLIELETLQEMIATHILPSAYDQMATLEKTFRNMDALKVEGVKEVEAEVKVLGRLIKELVLAKKSIIELAKRCRETHDHDKAAHTLATEAMDLQHKVRNACDDLEAMCDDFLWSLPKYREMLCII